MHNAIYRSRGPPHKARGKPWKSPSFAVATSSRFRARPTSPTAILRAMDAADHRPPRPGVRPARARDPRGPEAVFRPTGAVVIYPSSGTGAWEAALVNPLVARRPRAHVETGQFAHALAARWRAAGPGRRLRPRRLAHGVDPTASRRGCARTGAMRSRRCVVVHNETSTGVASRVARVAPGDRTRRGHPALLIVDTSPRWRRIDYRHDEWGVDVTVERIAEGADAPARPGLQRDRRRRRSRRRSGATLPRSYWDWERDDAEQRVGLLPLHARHEAALRAARSDPMLHEEGLGERLLPPRPLRRGDAARPCAPGGWRSSAPEPREYATS